MKGQVIFLVVGLLCSCHALFSQENASDTLAENIALDLFYAHGEISEQKPTVTLHADIRSLIEVDEENASIQLDEEVLNLLNTSFPEYIPESLASILSGPILALYSPEQDSLPHHSAGVLAYLAGYSLPLEQAKELWTLLYNKFPTLSEQQSLESRISLLEDAERALTEFRPLFLTANYMVFLDEYAFAQAYYELIKGSFPGREIHNNLGLIKALQAYELFSEAERDSLKYTFPFVLDMEFANTKGAKSAEQKSLFEAAILDFEEALNRDPNYTIAFINLSCVYSLLGNYTEAIYLAEKADSLADQQNNIVLRGNALIALGIAQAMEGNTLDSDNAFKKASRIEDISVQHLVFINTDPPLGTELIASTGRNRLGQEKIGPNNLGHIRFVDEDALYSASISVNDSLELALRQGEGFTLYRQKNLRTETLSYIQTANPDYEQASKRGIKIGSDITEVEEAYGQPPTKVKKTGTGKFYFYKSKKIVFQLDKRNEVVSWVLFDFPLVN